MPVILNFLKSITLYGYLYMWSDYRIFNEKNRVIKKGIQLSFAQWLLSKNTLKEHINGVGTNFDEKKCTKQNLLAITRKFDIILPMFCVTNFIKAVQRDMKLQPLIRNGFPGNPFKKKVRQQSNWTTVTRHEQKYVLENTECDRLLYDIYK